MAASCHGRRRGDSLATLGSAPWRQRGGAPESAVRKRVDAAGPACAASVLASPPAPGRLAPQGGLSVRVQLGQSGHCIHRGGSLISRLQLDYSRPRQTRMQTSNRFFDDLAKVASGAASTVVGIRQEIEAVVRQRIERLVADFDLVRRDEFESVKAMAANAQAEQEHLARRLAELEAKLAGGAPGADEPASDTEREGE